MSMLILGIDPGASGGISWQVLGQRDTADASKMPDTEADYAALFKRLIGEHRHWFAYIERVGATPQMGVCSAFTFGKNYGLLRGLLSGLAIPFEEVNPIRWQADFGLRSAKKLAKGDTEKHRAIKAKAQQLFPWLQVTNAKAAALLISEWGARQQRMNAA